MFLRPTQRLLSIALAAALTLVMLGAVDGLSQPDSANATVQLLHADTSLRA